MNDKYNKYHKYKHFICHIELCNPIPNTHYHINNLYRTDKCKIIKIINMIDNNEIDKIDEQYYKDAIIEKNRQINLYDIKIDMPDITYFISYERCFYYNFIEDKQYLLFDEFCGIYKQYDDKGEHKKTFLINKNNIFEII